MLNKQIGLGARFYFDEWRDSQTGVVYESGLPAGISAEQLQMNIRRLPDDDMLQVLYSLQLSDALFQRFAADPLVLFEAHEQLRTLAAKNNHSVNDLFTLFIEQRIKSFSEVEINTIYLTTKDTDELPYYKPMLKEATEQQRQSTQKVLTALLNGIMLKRSPPPSRPSSATKKNPGDANLRQSIEYYLSRAK